MTRSGNFLSVLVHEVKRALPIVRSAFITIAILSYVVMCLSVGFQVTGRYLLNYPIARFAEVATYAQVWLATMGAGYALRTGTLFAMDSLVVKLGQKLQRIILIVNLLLGLVFLSVLFYGSLSLVKIGEFQTSPTLGIPMWLIYLSVPICAVYLAFENLALVLERWDHPYQPTDELAGVD